MEWKIHKQHKGKKYQRSSRALTNVRCEVKRKDGFLQMVTYRRESSSGALSGLNLALCTRMTSQTALYYGGWYCV